MKLYHEVKVLGLILLIVVSVWAMGMERQAAAAETAMYAAPPESVRLLEKAAAAEALDHWDTAVPDDLQPD